MCRCVVVPVVVVCGHFCPVVLVNNNDVTGDRRKQTSLRRSATERLCVCIPLFLSTRPSDRTQILHTYSDRYGTHSHLNKLAPRMARKAGLIGNNLRNSTCGGGLWRRMKQHVTATCIRVCIFPAHLIT